MWSGRLGVERLFTEKKTASPSVIASSVSLSDKIASILAVG